MWIFHGKIGKIFYFQKLYMRYYALRDRLVVFLRSSLPLHAAETGDKSLELSFSRAEEVLQWHPAITK